MHFITQIQTTYFISLRRIRCPWRQCRSTGQDGLHNRTVCVTIKRFNQATSVLQELWRSFRKTVYTTFSSEILVTEYKPRVVEKQEGSLDQVGFKKPQQNTVKNTGTRGNQTECVPNTRHTTILNSCAGGYGC